jgi:hypothetical protein
MISHFDKFLEKQKEQPWQLSFIKYKILDVAFQRYPKLPVTIENIKIILHLLAILASN